LLLYHKLPCTRRNFSYIFLINLCESARVKQRNILGNELFLTKQIIGISHAFPARYIVVRECNCLPTCHYPFWTCPSHLMIIVRVWSVTLQLPVYLVSELSKSSFWRLDSEMVGANHPQAYKRTIISTNSLLLHQ